MDVKIDQTANDMFTEIKNKSIEKIQTKAQRQRKNRIYFLKSTVDMQNKVRFNICLTGITERD